LDACPPNFTPVEDPTFSSFSPGAWGFFRFDIGISFGLNWQFSRGRRAFAGCFREGISGRQAFPVMCLLKKKGFLYLHS